MAARGASPGAGREPRRAPGGAAPGRGREDPEAGADPQARDIAQVFGPLVSRVTGNTPPPTSPELAPALLGAEPGRLQLQTLFPACFTFCAVVFYMWPVLATLDLANDPSVRYFIGNFATVVVAVPLLVILLAHLVHAQRGTPSKPAIVACLFLPSTLMLVINEYVLGASFDKASLLMSSNCTSFSGKAQLHKDWTIAYSNYTTCLNQTVQRNTSALTLNEAFQLYRFYECTEYPAAYLSHRGTWSYLRSLEETFGCSGWCTLANPLFTFQAPDDTCSQAAAQVFSTKIQRVARQVIVYISAVLVGGSLTLIYYGPYIRRSTARGGVLEGVKW